MIDGMSADKRGARTELPRLLMVTLRTLRRYAALSIRQQQDAATSLE